jgi:hypothetical protein
MLPTAQRLLKRDNALAAIAKLQGDFLKGTFISWSTFAQREKRNRSVCALFAAKLRGRHVAASLVSWLEFVDWRNHARRLLAHVLGGIMRARMRSACTIWAQRARDAAIKTGECDLARAAEGAAASLLAAEEAARASSVAFASRARAVLLATACAAYARRRYALFSARAFAHWAKCARAVRVRERVTKLSEFLAEVSASASPLDARGMHVPLPSDSFLELAHRSRRRIVCSSAARVSVRCSVKRIRSPSIFHGAAGWPSPTRIFAPSEAVCRQAAVAGDASHRTE